VVAKGVVPFAGRMSTKALRKALTIILAGLAKSPKTAVRPKGAAPPTPPSGAKPPPPSGAKPPPPTEGGSLVFDPDPVVRGAGSGSASGAGSAGTGTGGAGSAGAGSLGAGSTGAGGSSGGGTAVAGSSLLEDENPLAPKAVAVTPKPVAATAVTKKAEDPHGSPKVSGAIGLGTWLRRMELNQPDSKNPAPKYDSGAAFALALELKARPIAFLTNGFLEGIYSRLHFQTVLGLQSRDKSTDESFGTSLWELCWEVVGFDWNVLSRPTGPHAELGIGFGLMSFAVDWAEATTQPMPDASYKFFMIALGGYWPFLTFVGAHLRFDYRVVTGAGEIEEDDWYGPSSTGGLSFRLGVDGNYRGFIAGVEYAYTRYFYAFTDAEARLAACQSTATCKRAAGGALDQQHGFIISVGYSY